MYAGLCTLRNGQAQLQWNRLQMIAILSTVAVPIVFGSGQSDLLKCVVSTVNFVAIATLFFAATRGDKLIRYWDDQLAELERLDQQEYPEITVRVLPFSSPQFGAMKNPRITTRRVLRIMGIFFLIA